jgi:hypothetical protein
MYAVGRGTMLELTFTSMVVVVTAVANLLGAGGKSGAPPKAVGLAELLSLPDEEYRAEPYLRAAGSLQALGEEKACSLLGKLASKDRYPYTRTLSLCRMLFEAKPRSTFRRAYIGAAVFLGGTEYGDWPLEPIAVVDGVPFLITKGYNLGGQPERPLAYVRYCMEECRWNTFKFKVKPKEEMRKALEKLLSSRKLKGKLDRSDQEFLEGQVK